MLSGIPIRKQGKSCGKVVFEPLLHHVLIHFISTMQELIEYFRSQRDHERQTNGAPNREPSAHPRPHRKAVFFGQIHFRAGAFFRAHNKNVLRALLFCLNTRLGVPLVHELSVEHRLAG